MSTISITDDAKLIIQNNLIYIETTKQNLRKKRFDLWIETITEDNVKLMTAFSFNFNKNTLLKTPIKNGEYFFRFKNVMFKIQINNNNVNIEKINTLCSKKFLN